MGDKKKYLKEKCGDKFKCPRSDDLYSVELYKDILKYTVLSCTLKHDRLCPNDPKFYEVCGHIRPRDVKAASGGILKKSFVGLTPVCFKVKNF